LKTSNAEIRKSYANITANNSATKEHSTIKSIVKAARDEEIAEDHEKRRRASNVIVHSVPEQNEVNKEDCLNADRDYIISLINDIRVKANIKYIGRIGNQSPEKLRPIKIVFEKEDEELSVLRSLPNLKQHNHTYKGISVTEDFTQAEREIQKRWSQKAKERNDKENDDTTIWRVRGSPKNGLFLKKFHKKNPQA